SYTKPLLLLFIVGLVSQNGFLEVVKSHIKWERKVVVIVDGYSTGRYLAPAFSSRGYTCIHVQSHKFVPDILLKTFQANHYLFNIVSSNLEEILQKLKDYDVKCVVVGSESGVKLANKLSYRLGLPHNDMRLQSQ
ncbi:MAG: hypothetical protein AAF380_01785, partial [Bacteroidota bacterium]